MNSLKCFSIKSAERVISESVNLRRKPTPWSQIYISNMANTISPAWVVFCYCNKTPETTCRVKNAYVTSLFLSFQPMIIWPCCSRPTARQQHMEGAGGRINPPSSQPGNRKEWRGARVSHCSSWESLPWAKDPIIGPHLFAGSTTSHKPWGPNLYHMGLRGTHNTQLEWDSQQTNSNFVFRQQQTSVWKSIHQNCNTCRVCHFNLVERKLVDAHRKHQHYWTEGPTCGPSQHTDVYTEPTECCWLMVLLRPLILLFHDGYASSTSPDRWNALPTKIRSL